MTNEEKLKIKNIANAVNEFPLLTEFLLRLFERWKIHTRENFPYLDQLINELNIKFVENSNKKFR